MNREDIKKILGNLEVSDEVLNQLEEAYVKGNQKSFDNGIKKAKKEIENNIPKEEVKDTDNGIKKEKNNEIELMQQTIKEMQNKLSENGLNNARDKFKSKAKDRLTKDEVEYFSNFLNEEQLNNFDFSLRERQPVEDMGHPEGEEEIMSREKALDEMMK